MATNSVLGVCVCVCVCVCVSVTLVGAAVSCRRCAARNDAEIGSHNGDAAKWQTATATDVSYADRHLRVTSLHITCVRFDSGSELGEASGKLGHKFGHEAPDFFIVPYFL